MTIVSSKTTVFVGVDIIWCNFLSLQIIRGCILV